MTFGNEGTRAVRAARQNRRSIKWSIVAESVRGAAHCRGGQPNQDAVEWLPSTGSGLPLILAVSDGHGSPRSFRSDQGSRLAVSAALEEATSFLKCISDGSQPILAPANCKTGNSLPLSKGHDLAGQSEALPEGSTKGAVKAWHKKDGLIQVKREAEKRLPTAVVRGWRDRVLRDISDNPFTLDERRRMITQYGSDAWQGVEENPLAAYGATLLVALATASFLVLAQIGDGDIVTVSPGGCAERPLRTDPRIFAGETTSLCLNDAVTSFVVGFRAFPQERPALVLMSTDGYVNSYPEDEGFLSVGPDILSMIREDGLDAVRSNLPTWLDEVSQLGSGDDVTLGLMCLF